MPNPLRRIKRAKIKFLSLVPKGANKLPVIYKEDDNSLVLNPIVKAGEDFLEKGELLVIAYAPEITDSQGDIASSDVIKEMAYDYMRSGGQIDIRHDGEALSKEDVYVAENFIVQKSDPRFANFTDYDGKPVDVEGSWGMVLKIEDANLRQLFKSGKWGGVSIQGSAQFEKPELSKAQKIVRDLVASMGTEEPTSKTTEEVDIFMTVTEEKLVSIFKEQNESLVKGIAEAIQKAQPETAEQKQEKLSAYAKELGIELPKKAPAKKTVSKEEIDLTEAPVFKGDPSDLEALKVHGFELKKFELRKDLDWSDPEALAEYSTSLTELNKEEGVKPKKKPGKSKVPDGTVEKDSESEYFDSEMLEKEEIEGAEAGEEVAKYIREQYAAAAGGGK